MTIKPTVLFVNPQRIEIGFRASVYALNHPTLGRLQVSTSRVLKINEDGSFETLNTIYVPDKSHLANRDEREDSPMNTKLPLPDYQKDFK